MAYVIEFETDGKCRQFMPRSWGLDDTLKMFRAAHPLVEIGAVGVMNRTGIVVYRLQRREWARHDPLLNGQRLDPAIVGQQVGKRVEVLQTGECGTVVSVELLLDRKPILHVRFDDGLCYGVWPKDVRLAPVQEDPIACPQCGSANVRGPDSRPDDDRWTCYGCMIEGEGATFRKEVPGDPQDD